MESLAFTVSVLLGVALLGGPFSMYLASRGAKLEVLESTESLVPKKQGIKAAIATLATLSIFVNVMFLIGSIPITLRLLSFLALCTGLISIKKLYFQKK